MTDLFTNFGTHPYLINNFTNINVFLFNIRLFTVIAYIYIYSQLQVYVSRHMILVNFMFTPDELRYKNNQ